MEYKSLPDLKALVTLREIVERGGVAEAGRALNVGQPAVTKRLRALERSFGLELMVREAGRLRLTTAGERVYQFARLVMDHQLELVGDLNQLKAGKPITGKDSVLGPLIKQLTETALEAEMDTHLAQEVVPNRKNGKSRKTMKSSSGEFELETPRDRAGTFEPKLVLDYTFKQGTVIALNAGYRLRRGAEVGKLRVDDEVFFGLGVEVPVRAQYIRVMFDEITRILNHLLWLGAHGLDIGAMTMFLYTFREREDLMDCYEAVSGTRMHATYYRPGGVYRDLPDEMPRHQPSERLSKKDLDRLNAVRSGTSLSSRPRDGPCQPSASSS